MTMHTAAAFAEMNDLDEQPKPDGTINPRLLKLKQILITQFASPDSAFANLKNNARAWLQLHQNTQIEDPIVGDEVEWGPWLKLRAYEAFGTGLELEPEYSRR